jgi:hypothetical protein
VVADVDLTDEVVYTSRRAWLLEAPRTWTPGRLRVSDRALRFTAHGGATTELPLTALASVRIARLPRRALVLETAEGTLHLRCFAVPAIAALLQR